MKLTKKLLVLLFGALMLANAANAESPREQLKQMVGQLQTHPGDNALREQIIKLAQTFKPAPALPEEAERFEGRAQFAFKNAKSPADYLDAAKEYEKAIAAAPWVPGYYADLCTIYEKAEKYAEAKKSCEFFLASSPSVQDASEVRKRVAGLEFAMEKGVGEKFITNLDGARFVYKYYWRNYANGNWRDGRLFYMVRGNKVFTASVLDAVSSELLKWDSPYIGVIREGEDKDGYLITGHEFIVPKNASICHGTQQRCVDEIWSISEDGLKISGRTGSEERIYLREQ